MAITLYPTFCDDYSTNGLGVLTPTSCIVSEESCGMFELELQQPIDSTLRWAQLAIGCVIKVPTPTRESPLYETEGVTEGFVTRNVWAVQGAKSGIALYNKPSGKKKKLATIKNGARVNEIGRKTVSGTLWLNVIAQNGGRSGWMSAKKNLVEDGTVTENLWNGQIVNPKGVQREQCREQLFRIYSVERDAKEQIVTAKAMHITYDLRGTLVNSAYNVEKKTKAQEVLEHIWGGLATEHEFDLHIVGEDVLATKIIGDYSWKNPIECMLDPDEGVLSQAGALLLRDNFDLFVLPDVTRDSGVTIRRGKNLTGVTVTQDASDVVTRLIPCGKTKDGDDLFLEGTNFVDSPRINDYPFPLVQKVDYDVKVSDKDVDNETIFKTAANARKKLKELAEADFSEHGIDLPTYGMDVDFTLLQNTDEYAEYAGLQSVYLNDTVTVIDSMIGLTAKVRVTGYEWNALTQQYERLSLGDLSSLEQTVYSYNLPTGGVNGNKIAPGTLGGQALRNLAIEYAKISVAAIEQLTADSVVALTARIKEIITQNLTTDELYAALASLNRAVIEHADIDWANIQNLRAAVAAMAQASIGTADIGWGQIKDLVTGNAIITQGVSGKLYIADLAVTEANMVSLTVGELLIKGADDKFYSLSVDEEGNIVTQEKLVAGEELKDYSIDAGEKIIEGSIHAEQLDVKEIFAENGEAISLITKYLKADELFARDAIIDALKTAKIYNDSNLEIYLGTIDTQNKWFSFDNERGFTVRRPEYTDADGVVHPASPWRTVTNEVGYHIYGDDSNTPIGSFNRNGLTTTGIQFGDIIARKTSSGGWVWTDGA